MKWTQNGLPEFACSFRFILFRNHYKLKWGLVFQGILSGGRDFFKIFKNICRTHVLFVGPLIPLFWTSDDVCPGFQSQGGFPRLRASSPAHNGFLRFTSGATHAFSTNIGVHCISMYTAWLAQLLSHTSVFEPPMLWWAAQWCMTKSEMPPTELSLLALGRRDLSHVH